MIAAYRIAVEHKSIEDAVIEMHQFHYDHLLLPQLQRYVVYLPRLLKSDATFSAYAPATAQASGPATAVATTVPVSVSH